MPTRSKRGLATWVTSSPSPVFLLNARRVLLVFNRGCEELTGWPASELIGKTCHIQSVANPNHYSCVTGALCPPELDFSTASGPIAASLLKRDGQLIEFSISYFPLLSFEGQEASHILGMISPPVSQSRESHGSRRIDVARHTAQLFQKYQIERFIAQSPATKVIANQIHLARHSQCPVHFHGEKGVGKEHIARLIHYHEDRRDARFLPIRCSESSRFEVQRALNRTYQSDANQEKVTLYLDQIQALPLDLQQLVLKHLESQQFRHFTSSPLPLTAYDSQSVLPELKPQLAPISIFVPPLRERFEDLPLIAQQLLEEFNQTTHDQINGLSPAVEKQFLRHRWPGNIDELSRVVTQSAARTLGHYIDSSDLPLDFTEGYASASIRPRAQPRSLTDELAEFEKNRIQEALDRAQGNKSIAAEALQIPRAKLYRRLAALGMIDEHEPLDLTGDDVE